MFTRPVLDFIVECCIQIYNYTIEEGKDPADCADALGILKACPTGTALPDGWHPTPGQTELLHSIAACNSAVYRSALGNPNVLEEELVILGEMNELNTKLRRQLLMAMH